MSIKAHLLIVMLTFLLLPPSSALFSRHLTEEYEAREFDAASLDQGGVRRLQPIYVRLQALENGSVIVWESVPRSFHDHVGTIDLNALAIFVSSNARSINLSEDAVGNLWMAINYTFTEGDYISSLIWASSETISQNLTIPSLVSFPQSYPADVMPFLDSGTKIPADNQTIVDIATSNKTENMVETVLKVLDFVNKTQEYDGQKTKLLMSGNLNTTSLLDFIKGPLETLETGLSFCFERSLLAQSILRAAGVPARTFTDAGLKTWIQVWLPEVGWVDAEALCATSTIRFPLTLISTIPWMIQNSSDAIFPFLWSPEARMRIANLTFSDVEAFNINEYRTVLVEPIDQDIFAEDPSDFSFPIAFRPDIVSAAFTYNESNFAVTLMKGKENASKVLVMEQSNEVSLGDIALSFKPVLRSGFVFLENFIVQKVWVFDLRLLIPIIAVPIIIVILWLYRKRTSR